VAIFPIVLIPLTNLIQSKNPTIKRQVFQSIPVSLSSTKTERRNISLAKAFPLNHRTTRRLIATGVQGTCPCHFTDEEKKRATV
ncbi:hypothetical protein N7539_005078, partial [Penicillium diatomitis]